MRDLQILKLSTNQPGVSAADCLLSLHRRGRLKAVALEALADKLIGEAAREARLAPSTEELQQAANRFRQQLGLNSAARTQQWLAEQGWTTLDFQAALERDLLAEKLRDHLTRDRIASHFAANQADYARARLRTIVVAREDFARELLTQLRDEDRDFAALARQNSIHATADNGGYLGVLMRQQLVAAVAERVFAARAGDVIGPVSTPEGFHVVLVEAVWPAELDMATTAVIRQELFDAWLGDKLKDVSFASPPLDDV